MNDVIIGIMGMIALILLSVFVWVTAHSVVAQECEKLGAFYVGTKVYDCKVRP